MLIFIAVSASVSFSAFSAEDFELIDKAFSARIDSQYYVNREVPDENYNLIIKKTP